MIARNGHRSGMTLIEVMIALVILTGAVLGMGKFITSFAHATSDGALSSVASDLVLDRLETIKGSTSYAGLDAYNVTESAIPGFTGYKRVTLVTRTLDATEDYKAVTVTVSNPGLSTPVKKSTIIAAF
ncbi:MAG: prepilin-type N-terminal cleavage/methylation domain-containing protein [Gemmatimonadaceae bacterium]|nr:prepilin-type N-terminal cleavage/methylation domain-containing protein [Gemmatimonadaceae bacterium]